MRIVVQRVTQASVTIEGEKISEIGEGLMILVGIEREDTYIDAEWLANKTVNMRIFPDNEGLMNLSVKDIKGDILSISQFTLMASTRKGNRPSYIGAARPEIAEPLYDKFCELLSEKIGNQVKKGIFGADMKVSLINDGPVTIIIDTKLKE